MGLSQGCFDCNNHKNFGEKIIKSAILFELGVAVVIAAEGKLISKLVERDEHPFIIIKAEEQASDIISCIKNLEEKIVSEIEKKSKKCCIE